MSRTVICAMRSLTGLVLGLWVATQLFAFQMRYPKNLGAGLHRVYDMVVYAPYDVGVWLGRWPGLLTHPKMGRSLLTGLALTGLCLLWTWVNRSRELAHSSHGSSRWATKREVMHLGESS